MKIIRTHKQMIFCFLPGFLLGIFYMNLVFRRYGGMKEFYVSDFLIQYFHSNGKRMEYFVYILRIRMIEFGILSGLMTTKLKKKAAYLILVWTGFLFGILMSVSVISMGIKGCSLCALGLMPQIIFYIIAFVILLNYGISFPYSKWNKLKTEAVLAAVAIGMLTEVYINPFLLKLWLKI